MAKLNVGKLKMKLTKAGPDRLRISYPTVQLKALNITERPNYAVVFGKKVAIRREDWRIEVGKKHIAMLGLKPGQVVNVSYVKYPNEWELLVPGEPSESVDTKTGNRIYRDTEAENFVLVDEPPAEVPKEVERRPGMELVFTAAIETSGGHSKFMCEIAATTTIGYGETLEDVEDRMQATLHDYVLDAFDQGKGPDKQKLADKVIKEGLEYSPSTSGGRLTMDILVEKAKQGGRAGVKYSRRVKL